MSEFIIDEGNLMFDFTGCGKPVKFDAENVPGLSAVDFFVEAQDYLLFIEVKDYQNPRAPRLRQDKDLEMLLQAGDVKESTFSLKMGGKIKDSLLRLYAEGESFTKRVIYLLFINCDILQVRQRWRLLEKISGYIPKGLNNDRFTAFKEIDFKLVDAKSLKDYGIICTPKQ